MLNVAVLGSGRGSNFAAIVKAIQEKRIGDVRIAVVISNNSDSGILEIGQQHGIPAVHLSQKQFADESLFAAGLMEVMRRHGTDFIVLAGYMKRVPTPIIEQYRNRIINIHPALLPKFGGTGMYGMRVHEAVIAASEKTSGATVHFVDEEYDRGGVVLQKSVAVAFDDTPETLASKVLNIEHELLPEALRLFAEGKVHRDVIAVH
ncbi:MAG: phosphoribosylglycinamide formyltransferase [Bacteroidota bacterium]